MNINYKIRAVQLDLARQMESMEFLKGFIDFIAENHYNTLFLYLEWRVRTFPKQRPSCFLPVPAGDAQIH